MTVYNIFCCYSTVIFDSISHHKKKNNIIDNMLLLFLCQTLMDTIL